MTSPANSTTDRDGQRTYRFTDFEGPSTTSVGQVVAKPQLVTGSRKGQAEVILRRPGYYIDMLLEKGFEETRLQASRDAKRLWDDAADLGSRVHTAIEQVIRYGEWEAGPFEDDVAPYVQQFYRWVDAYEPIYEMCEFTIYNREHNYAGTVDLVASILSDPFEMGPPREYVLIDVKTGKNVYPDFALQLAAYRNGEFVGRDGQELPMPPIDRTAILHLQPDGWDLVFMDTGAAVFDAFLAARRLHDWCFIESKGVIL